MPMCMFVYISTYIPSFNYPLPSLFIIVLIVLILILHPLNPPFLSSFLVLLYYSPHNIYTLLLLLCPYPPTLYTYIPHLKRTSFLLRCGLFYVVRERKRGVTRGGRGKDIYPIYAFIYLFIYFKP